MTGTIGAIKHPKRVARKIQPSFIFLFILIAAGFSRLSAQSSLDLTIGSLRPMGPFAENHPKEGILDVGGEFQTNLNSILKKEINYFPLSVGIKIAYNYYTVVNEKSGELIYDTTGLISFFKYEYKYTLRAHALNFHPFIEISTPSDLPFILFLRAYWGPTTSWATSKLRYISEDSTGNVTKDITRDYAVNRWTFDYGYKIGLGGRISEKTYLTASYTRIWGGEIE